MKYRIQQEAREGTMLLNMGPSHPAMHGTTRVMLELDGEKIINCELEMGYLHRGFEKICESKSYFNMLIYTDRMNYVSPLINNTGYVMTLEKMLGVEVPERAMCMECGAFTVFLYMMKAREYIWDLMEQTTGARMTTSFIRVGGVRSDFPADWKETTRTAIDETRKVLKDCHGLMSKNKIFLNRTRDVAVVTQEMAINYGWTGPCLRSTGVYYDVRKAFPYLIYDQLDFEIPLGERGDNFDRYMVRMQEMEQSLRMVEQCVAKIPEPSSPSQLRTEGLEPADAIKASRTKRPDARIKLSPNLEGTEKEKYPGILAGKKYIVPPKEDTYTNIEGLINHFKFFMRGHGIRPPKGEVYFAVEGGSGELGFYIISDGTDKPYRLHLRAPCLHIVAALEEIVLGHYIADVIPTFGSMNMIGGELDR